MPGKKGKGSTPKAKIGRSSGTKPAKKKTTAKSPALSKKTIEALRESDHQLKIVLDAAHMGIWEWDIHTNTLKWSGSLVAIFQLPQNYKVDTLDQYLDIVHPDDRPIIVEGVEASLKFNTPYYVQYRIIRQDTAVRWIEARGNVVHDKQGIPVKMTGTIQDITDKKNTEKEREDWKTRHELISSSTGLVVYDYDIHSGKILWSNNCLQVLGYKPEELGDIDRWIELVHKEDRKEASQLLEEAKLEMKAYDVYYRFALKNGTYCYIHDRGFFTADEKGKAHRMLGMMNDVSLRIKSEEMLRESEQRFRTLQQASFGGIGLHDQGMILDCNHGLCEMSGYVYEELIGSDGIDLIAPEWRDFVNDKINSGYEKTYDVEGIRKNGDRYFLEIRGKNIPYHDRTIRVAEFRDISNRKRNEEMIIEQNTRLLAVAEDLKRKNNQLEEFTQIVSHNLRSPVGNILTLLSFYENAISEEEKVEYFNLLKEASATTHTMLNELNDILQIKQNKKIEKQHLIFEEVLQQIKSMLNAKITQASASVTCDFSNAPSIHYPSIYLESILLNLLDNALKYHAPARKPTIHFSTLTQMGDIILQVKDNGLGINLERYAHQVFKLRKTFHHHPESRGIGLFMIKNQIEAMGGEISISSREDEGTSFFINFNKHQKDGI